MDSLPGPNIEAVDELIGSLKNNLEQYATVVLMAESAMKKGLKSDLELFNKDNINELEVGVLIY